MARPDFRVQFRPGAGPLFDPDSSGLVLDGGSFAISPDDSALDITGDIDVRIEVTLDRWDAESFAYASKFTFTPSTSVSWVLGGHDGYLGLFFSPDGTNFNTFGHASTETIPARDGERFAVRFTLDVDNGAGGHTITYYTADTIAGPWTQLGDPIILSGTTTLGTSTANLNAGAWGDGDMTGAWQGLVGTIHALEIRNGIGGSDVRADPVFSGRPAGTTSFTDDAGRDWEIRGQAVISEGVDIPWVTLTEGGPHGDRVIGPVSWRTGRERDDEDWPACTASLTLRNDDRLFDPENTTGTYYGRLDPLVPFRFQTSDDGGSTWDDQFYGFVESGWVQDMQPPHGDVCQIGLIDLFGVLAGRKILPAVFDAAVLSQRPTAFWRLGASIEGVADLAGGHHGLVVGSPQQVDSALVPDSPGALSLNADGNTDRVDISRSPLISDPTNHTVVAVFRTSTAAETDTTHPIFFQGNGSFTGMTQATLFVHTDGRIISGAVVDGSGLGQVSTDSVTDGHPHIVFAVHGGISFGIGLDTAATTATLAPAAATQLGNGVALGGIPLAPAGFTNNYFEGEIAAVAIWGKALRYVERRVIYEGYRALDGERSDRQIRWALRQLGVPFGLINLDEGRAIMGPADTAGVDALEFCRQVARTEIGAFCVDHRDGGKVRLTARYHAWLDTRATTSQATFSDDPGDSTAVRVEPGSLSVEPNGVSSITNSWTVSWRDGEATYTDAESEARFGTRGDTLDTQASTPNQALAIAQFRTAQTKEPRARIRGFGINPGAANAAFPTATGLRLLDRVTYRSQPGATGSVIEKPLAVEGTSHQVEGMRWETVLYTSDAPAAHQQLFILGTSELDSTDVLGV